MNSNDSTGIFPENLYTLDNLESLLGLTKRTLREAASKGDLKAIKKHKRYYCLGSWVIEYIIKES